MQTYVSAYTHAPPHTHTHTMADAKTVMYRIGFIVICTYYAILYKELKQLRILLFLGIMKLNLSESDRPAPTDIN